MYNVEEVYGPIKRVINLLQAAHQPAGTLPYRLVDIQTAIETIARDGFDIMSITVTMVVDSGTPTRIRGRYELYEQQSAPYGGPQYVAKLVVVDGGNLCKLRYVTVKEMTQCLLDHAGARVTDMASVMKLASYLSLSSEQRAALAQTMSCASEELAGLMALEILCPVHVRLPFAQALADQKLTTMQIAKAFRIPEERVAQTFDINYTRMIEVVSKHVK